MARDQPDYEDGYPLRPAPLFLTDREKSALRPTGTYRTTYEKNNLVHVRVASEVSVSRALPQRLLGGVFEPPSAQEVFFETVAGGDYRGAKDAIKAAMRANLDIGRYRGPTNSTSLHVAAARGLAKMTKLLSRVRPSLHLFPYLFQGCLTSALLPLQICDIEAKDDAGCTALHLAIRNGHAGSTEALALAGANFKAKVPPFRNSGFATARPVSHAPPSRAHLSRTFPSTRARTTWRCLRPGRGSSSSGGSSRPNPSGHLPRAHGGLPAGLGSWRSLP